MFDHVGLRITDLARSLRFYEEALGALGLTVGAKGDDYAGLGPKDAPALWLHLTVGAGYAHVALRAKDRAAVQAFHARGLAAGGRDNGPPGPREHYAPNYYAAFLLDPDGHNIEAVVYE